MVAIPAQETLAPEQAFEQLQVWWQQQTQLVTLRAAEVVARKRLADYYFAMPREGTNRLDLGGGYDLKLDFSYTRTVDEAALNAATAAQFKRLRIDKDALFPLKPTLSTKVYRTLTEEQRHFVDQLIDTKEATPQLHIVAREVKEAAAPVVEASEVVAAPPRRRATRKPAAAAPAKPARAARTRSR